MACNFKICPSLAENTFCDSLGLIAYHCYLYRLLQIIYIGLSNRICVSLKYERSEDNVKIYNHMTSVDLEQCFEHNTVADVEDKTFSDGLWFRVQ